MCEARQLSRECRTVDPLLSVMQLTYVKVNERVLKWKRTKQDKYAHQFFINHFHFRFKNLSVKWTQKYPSDFRSELIMCNLNGTVSHDERIYLLCPLDVENKMIIAKARYACNSTCSIFSMVEIDECKSLKHNVDSISLTHFQPKPIHKTNY